MGGVMEADTEAGDAEDAGERWGMGWGREGPPR